MGIKEENIIKRITDAAALRGHEIRIRDIAYTLLRVKLGDELIAYTVVFGTPQQDSDVTSYESLESVRFLRRWWETELTPKPDKQTSDIDFLKELANKRQNTDSDDSTISYEENREGIEQQLREIVEIKKQATEDTDENGKRKVDLKTLALLQKTEADLRVKLNDKFGAAEKSTEQYVYVNRKFNYICPHTRRECYQLDKTDAMERWHLIEDPNYKG